MMRVDGTPDSPLATAPISAGLMATMVAPADATAAPEPTGVSADRTTTPAERAIISTSAVRALRHIAQARVDIEDGELVAFARELERADILLDIVEETMPASVAKDGIRVARTGLDSRDIQEIPSDLAPVYGSLLRLARSMPLAQVGRHLDYSEADLPLRVARRLLAQAGREMRRDNPQGAEAALNAAEDNVVFLTIAMYEPLAEAHGSMWRAIQQYAAGTCKSAAIELRRAERYLEYSVGGTDGKARRIVAELLDKIHSLEAGIGVGFGDTTMLLGDIWSRTRALSARSAEYFVTGAERPDEHGVVKANLIEAKLHLSFAETDRFLLADSEAAQRELDQAANYLDRALTRAQSGQAVEIEAARVDMGKLNRSYTRDKLKDRYASLRQRLRDQIEMP